MFRETSSPILLKLLFILYTLNESTFRLPFIERWLWEWIKCECFWVAGGCFHSGNCCQNLMIMVDGTPINTKSDFMHHLKKKPNHDMFIPNFKKSTQEISHFSCSKLNCSKLCSDYMKRPQICHNYPASNFLMGSQLYHGCGFVVSLKSGVPFIHNSSLRSRFLSVLSGVYWFDHW